MQVNSKELKKSFIFSGGEVQIQLPELGKPSHIYVDTILDSSDKIMELLLVVNALDKYYPGIGRDLTIYYLPYARQDRHCVEGEANGRQVMVDLLDTLGFYMINITDVHSLENELPTGFSNLPVEDLLTEFDFSDFDVLVSPDLGARHKTAKVGVVADLPVVYCEKTRDPKTGNLSNTKVNSKRESIEGKNLLIVDDICDGGYTFVLLAQALQLFNPKSISLFVTHGIFSKGLQPLKDAGIPRIITTDSLVQKHNVEIVQNF